MIVLLFCRSCFSFSPNTIIVSSNAPHEQKPRFLFCRPPAPSSAWFNAPCRSELCSNGFLRARSRFIAFTKALFPICLHPFKRPFEVCHNYGARVRTLTRRRGQAQDGGGVESMRPRWKIIRRGQWIGDFEEGKGRRKGKQWRCCCFCLFGEGWGLRVGHA